MKLKNKYSLEDIALKYNCKIIGDKDVSFDSVSSLQKSKKNSISFISNRKLLNLLTKTNLSCIISSPEIVDLIKIPAIVTNEPLLLFSKIVNESYDPSKSHLFSASTSMEGIDKTVKIGQNVALGSNLSIGKNTFI